MLRYSIVVPVYNVEPYLRECLDSILAQDSPSEYEVIMVDDGSTDASGKICDEYAARYPNFQTLHQGNRGLAGARNSGLRAASGQFVLFFDSDDVWMHNLLSSMDGIAAEAPDITLFPFEEFDTKGNNRIVRPAICPDGESGEQYLQRLFAVGAMPPPSAWDCMFLRDFLTRNDLQFCEGLHSEDLDFSLYSFPAARSVRWINLPLYRYRFRQGSLSKTPDTKKWLTELDIINRWIERYPNSATANFYCNLGLGLAHFPNCAHELEKRYSQNADILRMVSKPKAKIARFLYHVFGFYGGAKAYMGLVRIKHFFTRPGWGIDG